MSRYQKAHYQEIAELLRKERATLKQDAGSEEEDVTRYVVGFVVLDNLTQGLVEIFSADNPAFAEHRFREATGA